MSSASRAHHSSSLPSNLDSPSLGHHSSSSRTMTEDDDVTQAGVGDTGDDEILAALEAMEGVISALSQPGSEFNISLHQQHLALAAKAGLEDQVLAARMMMVQSITCGDGAFRSYGGGTDDQAADVRADHLFPPSGRRRAVQTCGSLCSTPRLRQQTSRAHRISLSFSSCTTSLSRATSVRATLTPSSPQLSSILTGLAIARSLSAIPLLIRRCELVLRHWARLQEAEADEDLRDMLEDVAGLFTEHKVRDVLLDSAARASAHISHVSRTLIINT